MAAIAKPAASKRQAKTEKAATPAPTKKLGLENSATRIALLDVTEHLIRDQGFASITSRIVAAKAGLKPQLIHYYFNTMDDLYVEVFRRGAERDLTRLVVTLNSETPLRSIWKIASDPKSTRFVTEFMAMANHNDRIRSEITRYAEKIREIQTQALTRHLAARGIKPNIPPMVMSVLLSTLGRGLILEAALDISLGRAETEVFVEDCLRRFESGDAVGASPRSVSGPDDDALRAARAARRAAKRKTRRWR